MLNWYFGIKTEFSVSPGKYGKYLQQYLEPALWNQLMATYADADYNHTWDSLTQMGQLFRRVSRNVADHFDFEYPQADDDNVSAHIAYVRKLPKNTKEMY